MRTRSFSSSSDPVSATPGHTPVLLHEAIQYLDIAKNDIVVDATLGGAGHAREIVARLGKEGAFIGFDLDADAIARARGIYTGDACIGPTVRLIQANFRNITKELAAFGVSRVTKVVFDLGWSGYQLDSGRGFSFLKDEPLRMTYADTPGQNELTAQTILNEWQEESIADVIFGWGEERYARRIAKGIARRRLQKPIRTTAELVGIIRESVPASYRHGRIHPATRTFQALRIAVNDELGALKEGLAGAWSLLAPRGRIAVITFHSIEDREVKRMMVAWEKEGKGKRLSKKPLSATSEEIAKNPRARSAKLRVIEKI